jgi:hypothetical protein
MHECTKRTSTKNPTMKKKKDMHRRTKNHDSLDLTVIHTAG